MSRCDRCGCLLDEALDEYRVDEAVEEFLLEGRERTAL